MTGYVVTFMLPVLPEHSAFSSGSHYRHVERRVVLGGGLVQEVQLTDPEFYDRAHVMHVSVQPMPEKSRAEPGDRLLQNDGTAAAPIRIDFSHQIRWLPSEEPLYAILQRVVAHGQEHPTHGTDCACMDTFIGEVRRQITRAVPAGPHPDEEWRFNADAKARIAWVLGTAAKMGY